MPSPPGRRTGVGRWTFWALPSRLKIPILVVELLVLLSLVADAGLWVLRGPATTTALSGSWGWLAAMLMVAGVLSTEASLGVERVRRPSDARPHLDLSSIWTFAAAVLLPGPPACVVTVVVYSHMYLRVWRATGVPVHRFLFSTATILLAVQAASLVTMRLGGPELFRSVAGVLAVVVGMLAYTAVNLALVVLAIIFSGPGRPSLRQVVGPIDDTALEFATLSMGALVAAAACTFGPPYVLLGLPPLIVLHRTVLVRQLEEDASTDGKTGLLNAAAWRDRAGQAVVRSERAARPLTVLVLDLDHFKLVNDRFGHLVGDQVLAAVASSVRDEVRDEDIVGRFGGEEFVVLLRGGDGGDAGDARTRAVAVAERIRERIASLSIPVPGNPGPQKVDGLTVSIGGATMPRDGNDLAELLEIADAAMYQAKRDGRNLVRMGQPAATRPKSTRPPRVPRPTDPARG